LPERWLRLLGIYTDLPGSTSPTISIPKSPTSSTRRGFVPAGLLDQGATTLALPRCALHNLAATDAAGNRNGHEFLRRYFTFMGEAAIYDGLHRDVARCHLAEAMCYANEDTIETPLVLLVATYLRTVPSASDLSSDMRMQDILPQFENDSKNWNRFAGDFPYYSYLSVVATKRLDGDLRRNRGGLRNFLQPASELERARNKEAARIRKEVTQLRALQSSPYGASILQDHVTPLSELAVGTRFEKDGQRLKTMSSLFAEASSYWQEQDFVEKESKRGRLDSGLSGLIKDIAESPTKLSAEALQPLAKRLLDKANEVFEDFQRSAKPEVTLDNVLGDDYSILGDDGSLPVSLVLTSKSGSAPVEGVEIVISPEGGLVSLAPAYFPEVLRGGQSREIRILLKPTASQVSDGAFTLAATVRYRTRQGDIGETPKQTIPIRLGAPGDFVPIINPYQSYSGGTVVDNPDMFFGRALLLDRIQQQVSSGPVGQCFVLYGQKRSGKSSVLRQLERRINFPTLTVPITWTLWRDTECAVRDRIGDVCEKAYGQQWIDSLAAKHHGVATIIEDCRRRQQTEESRFGLASGMNLLDYSYPMDLWCIISNEWDHFRGILRRDKRYWSDRFAHLAKVRTPTAHSRDVVIPDHEVVLAKAY
jgi:hypothetical protein